MGSYQSIPDQSGAASQAGSRQASSSATKQFYGVVLFICSLFFLTLALGIGAGVKLSSTIRLASFIAAIICILVGLWEFGIL